MYVVYRMNVHLYSSLYSLAISFAITNMTTLHRASPEHVFRSQKLQRSVRKSTVDRQVRVSVAEG